MRESILTEKKKKKLVLTDKTYAMKSIINSSVMNYMSSMFQGISDEDLKTFEYVILQMTKNVEKRNN